MKRLALLSCLLVLALGCGNPEVAMPEPLEVVFISVDGAAEVATDATPEVFFSSAVDQQSATSRQIFLLHSDVVADGGDLPACGSDWESQGISVSFPAADNEADHMLQIQPDGELTAGHCYALVLTTAVKGSERGPLENLGLCDSSSNNPNADICAALVSAGAGDPARVGAFALFRVTQ